jgi:hypothetical protein
MRLERRQAEGLLVAGMHEHVGAGEARASAIGSATKGCTMHALAARRRRARAEREQHVGRPEPPHRVGQHVQVLLGRVASGVDEQAVSRGRPRRLRHIALARAGWNVRVSRRAAGTRTVHAPVVEVLPHRLAGREHEVEVAVQAPARSGRAGGGRGHVRAARRRAAPQQGRG